MSRKKKKAEVEAAPPVSEEPIAEAPETPAEEIAPEAAEETPVAEEPAAVAEETPAEEDLTEAIPGDEAATPGEEVPESTNEIAPPIALKSIIESVLFASQKAVSAKELISIFKGAAEAENENPVTIPFAKIKEPALRAAIEELMNDCANENRTYDVRESAAGWQLVTRPDFSPWLRQLYPENRSARLSAPAMETLAIIAYRQPITRADIEAVRGVAVDGVMQTLLDRGLVKIAGRAEIPGRPLLYETTQNFMEHFGLKDLDDLPNASELRKIDLPKAEVPAEEPPAPETTPSEAEAAPAPAEEPAVPTEAPAEVLTGEEAAVEAEIATEIEPEATAETVPPEEPEPTEDTARS